MSVFIDFYRQISKTLHMAQERRRAVLAFVREAGLARPRDLESRGIRGSYLGRLAREGLLEKVGRGLYTLAGAAVSEHRSVAETAKRTPRGVICLLSALRIHGLTTQAPHEVWLAIGPKDRAPKPAGVGLRIVRFSGLARTAGIQTQRIDGVPVRVYSPAKTVADCFKFRNKVGVDVAIDALRDCLVQRLSTADELDRYAHICRVGRVMRPYMEAML